MKFLKTVFFLLLSFCQLTSNCQKKSKFDNFKFRVSIDTTTYENESEINVVIKNRSLKTIYISSYDYKNRLTHSDSISSFSLDYVANYSDPLIMPNLEIPFYVLHPFGKIQLTKKKKNKIVNQINISFDYFSKSQLKSQKDVEVILKKSDNRKIYLKMKDFYNKLYLQQIINSPYHTISL